MRLKDYSAQDGKKVWLSEKEISAFLDKAKDSRQKVAFLLGARCGLRRDEIINVRHIDIKETSTGDIVRVQEGKGDKYREVPAPAELVTISETLLYDGAEDPDDPIVGVKNGSTIYKWVARAREELHAKSGDEGWLELGPHDLRRSWGVQMLEQGVLPSVVMDWGGWEDWETFREHYLDEFSPEALRRERNKVSYLSSSTPESDQRYEDRSPGVRR